MRLRFLRQFLSGCAAAGILLLVAGCKTSSHTTPSKAPLPAPAHVEPAAKIEQPIPVIIPPPPKEKADNMAPNILAADTLVSEYRVKPGDTRARFAFTLTNMSPVTVIFYDTSTSCDCTVAKLPTKPFAVAPGQHVRIEAMIDMQQEKWSRTSYIVIFTSKGNRMLTVKAILPSGP